MAKKQTLETKTDTKNNSVVDDKLKVPLVILGIHSNIGADASFADGHAWLSVSIDGVVKLYGLWPDDHPMIQAMGLSDTSKSDIRTGMELGQIPKASRYYKLTIKTNCDFREKTKRKCKLALHKYLCILG